MLWRRNSARAAQCVTIGVVPPVVRISGTVIVRRVRGKMDKFVVVQRKRKRSSSRERDFCKRDRNDTSSYSKSASQVFSSENYIGNFVGVPLTDADRRKVLFNCWSPPSGFSFPYVTVGMGAIWWGHGGRVPTTFLDGGDMICCVLPTFFSSGLYSERFRN